MTADPLTAAALLQMATPLVPRAPRTVERLAPEPRPDRKPEPGCDAGGPHRYPPGPAPACSICGTTPAASALAGIARAKVEGAFR